MKLIDSIRLRTQDISAITLKELEEVEGGSQNIVITGIEEIVPHEDYMNIKYSKYYEVAVMYNSISSVNYKR